jgi:hypothetical protein
MLCTEGDAGARVRIRKLLLDAGGGSGCGGRGGRGVGQSLSAVRSGKVKGRCHRAGCERIGRWRRHVCSEEHHHYCDVVNHLFFPLPTVGLEEERKRGKGLSNPEIRGGTRRQNVRIH